MNENKTRLQPDHLEKVAGGQYVPLPGFEIQVLSLRCENCGRVTDFPVNQVEADMTTRTYRTHLVCPLCGHMMWYQDSLPMDFQMP